ncbi:extracellular solute-binding protein [Paenibacillus sepulcri]|uniref:Extracellular solute-binding protein n=1 Tax=Paenibacillus sepulcri TaxID=359917 RepID=A0ABS7C9V3_9BACL|nr:extracellular solute-binding protein [Paenibacillus sepulcri]
MKDPVNQWERRLAEKPPIRNGFTSDIERKVRERIRMREKKRKSPFRAAAAMMCVVVLLGCGWWFRDDLMQIIQPGHAEDAMAALLNDSLEDEGDLILKVQDSKYSNFMNDIGRPFVLRHPSVEFRLTLPSDASLKNLAEWVDQEMPDVLRLTPAQFQDLAGQGKLKSLDILADKDGVKLDSMYDPVVKTIRQLGGGELYGFAPIFSTEAVYVNKKLFEKYKIELPKDGVTTDELLQIAMKFNGTGAAGLSTSTGRNGFSLFSQLGSISGLRSLSPDGSQLTLDTPAWNSLWSEVTEGLKAGWIIDNVIDWAEHPGGLSMEQLRKLDAFANGKAAMSINTYSYGNQLAQYKVKPSDVEWMAVAPAVVDASAGFYLDTIYAVNAQTTQEKAAWELVKFAGGPEYAKKLLTQTGSLPVYMDSRQLASLPAEQWKAFYPPGLDPEQITASIKRSGNEEQAKAQGQIYQIGSDTMKTVLDGKLQPDQALASMEEKLQSANPDLRKGTSP